MVTYPKPPANVKEFTVSDETNNWLVLIVLKIPSKPVVVLVVRLFITKLLANPVFVEIALVDTFEAVSRLVLRVIVLKKGGTTEIPVGRPVRPEPSPTNLAVMVPAEMVEKKP